MSQQYFTDSEWVTLRQAPMKTIQIVTLADKADPVSFLKETRMAIQLLATEQQQGTSSDLVNALLADLKEADASEPVQGEELLLKKLFQYLGEIESFKDANEGRTKALDHLKQVATILASKVTLKQAQEFRQWLISLAQKVADAVKEGGIFGGIGGERTSSDEAAAIKKIEQALELNK
jgi:ABC-type amino acid transport substrate-binding protein